MFKVNNKKHQNDFRVFSSTKFEPLVNFHSHYYYLYSEPYYTPELYRTMSAKEENMLNKGRIKQKNVEIFAGKENF